MGSSISRLRSPISKSGLPRRDTLAALKSSPMKVLPTEVILQIFQQLPLASAVSFSICCQHLAWISENKQIEKLRVDPQERQSFLSLLEIDFPDQIACYHCTLLHTVHLAHKCMVFGRSRVPPHRACMSADINSSISHFIHPDLGSALFSMISKCHRLGLNSEKYLDLLTQTRTMSSARAWHPYHCMTKAKIVSNSMGESSLLLRVNYMIRIPSGKFSNFPPGFKMVICPHSGSLEPKNDWNARRVSLLRSSQNTLKPLSPARCTQCHTEYQIDIKDFGKWYGRGVFMTKWLDIGLDIDGSKFKEHIESKDDRFRQPRLSFISGSIRAAFEGNVPFGSEFLSGMDIIA